LPSSSIVTLSPTDDVYVQSGSAAGTNFSSDPRLLAKVSRNDSFLRFDLTDVPVIRSARLRVLGRLSGTESINIPIGVFSTGSTFTEASVTSATAPRIRSLLGRATVANRSGQWWTIDLTSFLRAEKAAGRNVVTLALRNLRPSASYTRFDSKEAANGPQLQIAT
jgi:hypothetical protein